MMKRLVAAVSLALMAAAPAPKQITVGVYPSYPPLDMKDPATGTLRGFDVSLGQALAQRMGSTMVLQETSFAQFIASVETGRIDLFFNGMNDTPAREKTISFVDYLRSGTQFMVRAADAKTYSTPEDLCGKTVAGSRSTTLPQQIADWSATHCVASGKPGIRFLDADNNIDARLQLKQGRADAMVQDSLTIPYVQSQEVSVYATLGQPFDTTVMGIGVGKSATALQIALQKALQSMMDDGSYKSLVQTSGLPANAAIAKATIDQAE
ncbi:ABC transporter substrate-binding protein [Acidisoma cellulosilytica]|uniref:ABC transporter substrate-binding protein n=1 Tax=Acidisoma cellulosilyticum TaxID=2802395 RepID=A0A963YZR8_9PROT|nr:ABC transporter substrate-binding protein [Acidisoma cellulosilyticum]MCB8879879.1 ABC transporter substrate-binding protein [Acidisoma cellulosilyticum]